MSWRLRWPTSSSTKSMSTSLFSDSNSHIVLNSVVVADYGRFRSAKRYLMRNARGAVLIAICCFSCCVGVLNFKPFIGQLLSPMLRVIRTERCLAETIQYQRLCQAFGLFWNKVLVEMGVSSSCLHVFQLLGRAASCRWSSGQIRNTRPDLRLVLMSATWWDKAKCHALVKYKQFFLLMSWLVVWNIFYFPIYWK